MRTRWDRLTTEGRRDIQRRIYRLQIEQEQQIAATHADRVLLLDRGTVDGSAYWPEGPDAYWHDLGTSAAAELARYDAVIWMQTSAILGASGGYDGEGSNPTRYEPPAAAIEIGKMLKDLWSAHPHIHYVDASPTLDAKLAVVSRLLDTIVKP